MCRASYRQFTDDLEPSRARVAPQCLVVENPRTDGIMYAHRGIGMAFIQEMIPGAAKKAFTLALSSH